MGRGKTMFRQAALVGFAWVTMTTAPAMAEWFVDFYGGGGFPETTDLTLDKKVSTDLGTVRAHATLKDVERDNFAGGGVRFGYWFEGLPYVGLGVDTFIYEVSIPRQTVTATASASLSGELFDEPLDIPIGTSRVQLKPFDVTTFIIAFDLMLRKPLWVNTEFPKGRLQPYLTAAPALLVTDENIDVDLGAKVGAGLAWQFSRHVALFAEYRFTYFDPDVEVNRLSISGVRIPDPELSTDLRNHYVMAGISLRF